MDWNSQPSTDKQIKKKNQTNQDEEDLNSLFCCDFTRTKVCPFWLNINSVWRDLAGVHCHSAPGPTFFWKSENVLQIQISDTDPYSSARLGGFLCILQLRAAAAETLSLLRARLYFRQKYTTRTLQHIFQPDILLWDHIGHSMLGNLVLRTDLDFLWTGPSQFPKTASLLKESLLNQNQMQNMFSNPGFGLVSCKKKQKSAKVFGDFPFVPPDSAKLFSCPGQLNRWPCQSVSQSVSHFWFQWLQSTTELL